MEKLIKEYLKDVKKDVSKLRDLKKLFVRHQMFELASNVRALENELFPISEQDMKLQEEAINFTAALSLFNLDTDDKTSFVVLSLAKAINEKGDLFSLKDVSKIKTLADKLFD